MKRSPLVTVILTSFNHAKYLREAIDSVLAQTFTDFELIIWDDASTDGSWEIVTSYSDERIRAFRNETNHRAGNLKLALEHARGDYVAVHHSDDAWDAGKLERQVEFLGEHPEISAVFTWAEIVDEDGRLFQDESHPYFKIFEQPNRSRYEWLNFFFFYGNALCHPSILIRRNCYEECGLIVNGLAQITDLIMWVRLCMQREIYVLPEKLVRFRIRTGELNVSGNRSETRIRSMFETMQLYRNFLSLHDKDEFLRVFPQASEYFKRGEDDPVYALAKLLLDQELHPSAQLLGLQMLFDALQDPRQISVLQDQYDFRFRDFIALTARYDVFGRETIRMRDAEIAKIHASKAWKLVLQIRQMRLWLVPRGSLRAGVVGGMQRLVKALNEKIFPHN